VQGKGGAWRGSVNIEAHPAMDLSRMVGNLKTVSARLIRKEFAEELKPYLGNKADAILSVGSPVSIESLIR
jgi:putative transposase